MMGLDVLNKNHISVKAGDKKRMDIEGQTFKFRGAHALSYPPQGDVETEEDMEERKAALRPLCPRPPLPMGTRLTLLVAVAEEPGSTGVLVTCTFR